MNNNVGFFSGNIPRVHDPFGTGHHGDRHRGIH